MRNITANAILNLKEQPASLNVHGSIMTYAMDDVVKITKADIGGINTSILLLDLEVISGTGPMKGMPKPFHFETTDNDASQYSQVTIRYSNDASLTINIEVFG